MLAQNLYHVCSKIVLLLSLCGTPYLIFSMNVGCVLKLWSLDQFLWVSFHGFGRNKEAKFDDNVQSMLQCGVFGWGGTLIYLTRFLLLIT